MVFLIGILFGALFVWIALRSGLYTTFALMFNLVIAVYLAIFLRPIILSFMSKAGDISISPNSLTMLLTAAACFAILHGITFVFFTGPYNIVFPKIFDILAAGILGFIAGLFVWSFISLLITISPISQKTFLKDIGFSYSSQQAGSSNIKLWCGLIHNFVADKNSEYTVQDTIDDLLKDAEKQMKKSTPPPSPKSSEPADSNKPAKPTDPNKPAKTIENSNNKADPNKN